MINSAIAITLGACSTNSGSTANCVLFDAPNDARREQRVTAEIEERIVDADAIQPEHRAPDVQKQLLKRRARWR